MKIDFQQGDTSSDCCLVTSTLSFTTTPPSSPPPLSSSSAMLSTEEKPHHDDSITIVPFERHRQDDVATLFRNGLLSYDFTGNDAWKVVNEWFVADRMNKEMKDVYTGFNMMAATSKQQQQQQQAAAANDTTTKSASFEGLHFMTAIDLSTNQLVGCVGIKRPDQHTLAVLQHNVAELQLSSKEEEKKSNEATAATTCELVRLSVDQSCRRRGIGKMLVHAVEQFAQRHGYQRICLTTLLVQTQAVALYQSCGYSIVHQEALGDFIVLPNDVMPSQSENKKNIMSLVYLYKQLDV